MRKPINLDYIKGFADGEGHISAKSRHIQITNTEQDILEEIAQILKQHGIESSIHKVKSYTPNNKKCYRIVISGFWNLAKYAKLVGFSIPYKQKELTEYLKHMMRKGTMKTLKDYDFFISNTTMPMRTMARHFGVSLSVIQRRKLRWKITNEQRSILEWVEKELNDK